MEFPSNLLYTEDHEWIRVDEENNTVTVGITDFAQSELGELVYVEIDTLDEDLSKGEVFGTVEAVKTTSELFMPVSGKVIEFNSELNENEGDNPTLVNDSPYDKGWIVKIGMSNPEELAELLSPEAYEQSVKA